MRRGILTLAIVLLASASARAEEPLVTVSVSSAEVELGAPFYAFVEVSVPAGVEVSLPRPLVLGDHIEVLGRRRTVTHPDGRDLYTIELTLLAFALGEVEVPPIPILYSSPKGALETRSAAIRLTVHGTVPADVSEPREVAPVSIVRRDPSRLYWAGGLLGGGLLLATLVAFLVRALARRRALRSRVPTLSPLTVARDRFDALEASGALDAVDRRDAYVEMSEIAREYLARRHGILALDATTEEIATRLGQTGIEDEPASELLDWLRDADLVKFAGYPADADEARAALYSVRRWIEEDDKRLSQEEALA